MSTQRHPRSEAQIRIIRSERKFGLWSMLLGSCGVLLIGCLLLAQSPSDTPIAADAPQGAGESHSRRSHQGVLVSAPATASITLLHEGREIRSRGVHAEDPNSAFYLKGRHYSEPLFAFYENPEPIPGLPAIVQKLTRSKRHPDITALQFESLVSTEGYQKMSRDRIVELQRTRPHAQQVDPRDIIVDPWPLVHAIIVCRDAAFGDVLATAETGSLRGIKERMRFTMKLTSKSLAQFREAHEEGNLEFVYYYTYVGRKTYTGSVDVKGVKDLGISLKEVLSSEQADGSIPVLQDTKNEVIRHISLKIRKVIRASHKDLIPLLEPSDISLRMFEPAEQLSIDDTELSSPEIQKYIAHYLMPHLKAFQSSLAEQEIKVDLHEKEKTEEDSSGGVFGLPWLSITDAGQEFDRELERLEETTGISFQSSENGTEFRPHSVTVHKLRKGYETQTFDESTTIFLSVGTENDYLLDTPVPSTFTTALLDEAVLAQGIAPAQPILPFGTVMPTVLTEAPRGWRMVRPDQHWPHAEWVPAHLRGQAMPNMAGALLGGATNVNELAQVYNSGYFTIEGSNMSVGMKTIRKVTGIKPGSEHAVFGHFDGHLFGRVIRVPLVGGGTVDMKIIQRDGHDFHFETVDQVRGSHTVRLNSRAKLPLHTMWNFMVYVGEHENT